MDVLLKALQVVPLSVWAIVLAPLLLALVLEILPVPLLFPAFAATDMVFSNVVAVVLVNWWAPLFAVNTKYSDRGVEKTGYKLPAWLRWFDTFDADLDQGVRDGSIAGTSTYWNRVKWLNRNSAYGFSYWAIGTVFIPQAWRVIRYEETAEQLTFIAVSKDGHFNVHVTRFGLRFKLGWKAWNYYDKLTGQWQSQPWGPEWRAPFVFSISLA
ncbi:hypothetical protein [Herbaspirillum sp. NPDC101397]|uniref:DUF7338 family protein n=1 Tax=Herbaspirillum sp. NPDC101397 TaxID=3364006 RepID=UPI00383ABE69